MREPGEAKLCCGGLWEASSRQADESDLERLQEQRQRNLKLGRQLVGLAIPIALVGVLVSHSIIFVAVSIWMAAAGHNKLRIYTSLSKAWERRRIMVFAGEEESLGGKYLMSAKYWGGDKDFELTNLEIMEPDLIWKVNGRVVEASRVVVNALAMPSNLIDFNLDSVKSDRAEFMYRDLTSLEVAEIQALAKLARTKRRSCVGMTLTILVVAIFTSLAIFVTVESGVSGAWLFLVPIGMWIASFRLGLMFDMSSFKTYRGLKQSAAMGYVVMAKEQADDGSESFAYVPEYLMESGIVWTVDGEPADWRKEYLAPFRWK